MTVIGGCLLILSAQQRSLELHVEVASLIFQRVHVQRHLPCLRLPIAIRLFVSYVQMAGTTHRLPALNRTGHAPVSKRSMRTFAAQGSLLRSIQHSVSSQQQSAVEITKAYLQQLKFAECTINSFLTVDEEHAIAQVCLAMRLKCLRRPILFF